jgi:hypothetical protein
MAPDDRQRVEEVLYASDFVMLQKHRLPADHRSTVVLFDQSCRYELRDAAEESRRQTGSQ